MPLPETARAVVVANIDSYMGGGRLWYGDPPASRDDAKLEVLASLDPSRLPRFTVSSMGGSPPGSLLLRDHVRETRCEWTRERRTLPRFDGIVHLAQVRLGLARPHALAQGSTIVLKNRCPLPVHVDGEPWPLDVGTISIERAGALPVLINEADAGGYKLDPFSRHLIRMYEYDRGRFYAPDSPGSHPPRTQSGRPKLL